MNCTTLYKPVKYTQVSITKTGIYITVLGIERRCDFAPMNIYKQAMFRQNEFSLEYE